MAVGDVLRLFVIVAGVYMFLKAILSLAKRKMTEPFCLAWAVLSALVYQHTGIQSEKEKSGACHADLAVKS